MSDGTIPTPGASVGAEVVLESTGDTVTAAEAAVVEVRVTNPLAVPYRTGSYLIYDEGGTDHFRSAIGLAEHPYRASGSHQLDFDEFVCVLGQYVVGPYKPSTLYLVDLREETHGFFDGVAMLWYADQRLRQRRTARGLNHNRREGTAQGTCRSDNPGEDEDRPTKGVSAPISS